MTDAELLILIEDIKQIMLSVSTGKQRIEDVDDQYKSEYWKVSLELKQRRIENPIVYRDLWEWHGRWSKDDLPTYASRRVFLGDLFNPLVDRLRYKLSESSEPTGWNRVDRTTSQIEDDLAAAITEEQFQAIGMKCREMLISLAQAVYDPMKHLTIDNVTPSEADAKRMLEAFVTVEFGGGSNDEIRKYIRAVVDLSNNLQHRRNATFRDAALCLEASASAVNIIAILAGRRDPF